MGQLKHSTKNTGSVAKPECCNDKCKKTMGPHKMSQKGIDFLKGYESEVKKNGKHVLYNDDLGYCTIGYGHLVNGKKSCSKISQTHKNKYTNGLTDAEAEALLKKDIEKRETEVNKRIKVPLCQQEFDALMSLYFNIPASLKYKYSIRRALRRNDYEGAKQAISLWNKGTINGKKVALKGLTKRRKAEQNIFGCGIYDSTH